MSTEDRIKGFIGSADAEPRASEGEWNDFARRAHGALYTRRAAAALGTVALIGVVAFAAVSLRPASNDAPIGPADSTSPSPQSTPVPAPTASAEERFVEIPLSEQELWFVQGEKLAWSGTAVGWRIPVGLADEDPVVEMAAGWIDLLLAGPMGPNQEVGETTTIPEGTELLGVHLDGTTLFVDLTREFESGGGSLSMQMRLAQVVYTATQFEGIDAVRFMLEGQEVESIGGEGVIVSEPLTRRDYQDLAPNVVVEEPRPGQEFSPGDSASGFANVFEANVSFMVLDKDGKELKLATPFTTATCGNGCWGDFTHVLEFPLTEPQEGRIVVLTYSAEDGSPQDEIHIPVMLVP